MYNCLPLMCADFGDSGLSGMARSVPRQGGMVCTAMPHGVLFRCCTVRDIRKGFVDDDMLEAAIGPAPNLFYWNGCSLHSALD